MPQRLSPAPLDVRLARWLVRPLASTPVHPNHLTLFSLLLGLASAALFALGGTALLGWAAALYMVAVFSDHLDGELARLTGRTSRFGHYLDFLVGGLNYTLMFIGVGYGLWRQGTGDWALLLGLAAGLANPVIMTLRVSMENRFGFESVDHPQLGLFTIEDFIYLIGPLTWLGDVTWFFLPYGLGALGYLAWTVWEFHKWSRRSDAGNQPAT